MFRAKKYLLSFLIVVSLAILQFNTILGIAPASADATLFNSQSLLKNSAAPAYGSNPQSVKLIATKLINQALTFIALIMVVLLVIAGFKYMTSEGNQEETKKAMGQIKALVIGLLIILAAWGITYYILRILICNTSTVGTACTAW